MEALTRYTGRFSILYFPCCSKCQVWDRRIWKGKLRHGEQICSFGANGYSDNVEPLQEETSHVVSST